jgi:CubicO group peptidase (beta-lactamase class C family)
MKKIAKICIIIFLLSVFSCKKTPVTPAPTNEPLYFPPIGASTWETKTPESLGWKTNTLESFYSYLNQNNTRAFLVLQNGKIVFEKYFGRTIQQNSDFNASSNWYWASAGKTLTAFLVGVAQEEGKLNISQRTSIYLGAGWTSLSPAQENQITLRHQLTMTTGLDYNVSDVDCTLPSCLFYKAPAGSQWYYHNAPYTLLEQVVANATQRTFNQYTDEKLKSKIGMDGVWIKTGYNNVFYSSARSMARFGLMILANGKWENLDVLQDKNYLKDMINTSQDLNKSYGYLWWLNGKESAMYPGSSLVFSGAVAPNAPSDLVAAMGKNGQFLLVVPSKKLVIVRMGEAPDNALVPVLFHNELWARLNEIIP